ncbi:phosphatidylinositol N-acetylglucosaminyltransferase, GPI19/PIG-P subunit [Actinidia rufa]|uniref:Phosphatidylinositol N-acetylglucosaminyltransferase, GPI19/PIG-P subunit n=1 Tax=Actinidia rufa TaxID=165716 RepID=A0A7J0FE32_9ERIC|nr:phosphatidylinositol N-acetylglucosaminyltransferase, GPI19/PIG-P subunit [Actinidia rufa]
MEDQRSVNSPRRVLSLSRKRRGILSSPEPGDKADVFGPSGDHGPKPSEVYGFVGAISTVVATDEHSRDPSRFEPTEEGDEQPIEPLSDIGINQINDLMFNDQK